MRKLAIFCTAFASGTALYVGVPSLTMGILVGGTLLLCAFVLFFLEGDRAFRCRIAALGAALGLLWVMGYELLHIRPLDAYVGEDMPLTCTAADYAETTDYGCRVTAKLRKGKILLYLDCKAEEITPGDRLWVLADVEDASVGEHGEQDLYLRSRDIDLFGTQSGRLQIHKADRLPLWAWPTHATHLLRQKIRDLFPDDVQGFVLALLTGERNELSYGEKNNLSLSGISHVVAVSGMHVSLLVGLVLLFARRYRRLAAVLCMVVMLFFAVMLGFTPSVTRAVIMNSVFLLAPILRRENDPLTSLSFALWLILLFQPWAIANVSLQLSFGAMVGLFLLTPYFYRGIMGIFREEKLRKGNHKLLLRAVQWIAAVLSSSIAALVTTTPFVAYYFGAVSLVAPLSNLLLVWLVSLVFSLCFVVSLLAFFYQPLATFLAGILAWPVRLILRAVDALAEIPYGALYTCSTYVVIWLIFAYLLLAVFLLLRRRKKLIFATLFVLSLTACILLCNRDHRGFRFTAMDVGQGQCTVLQCGTETLVIDCGGDREDESGERLARKLLMEGDRTVEYLLLTHYDADHTCGVLQLMDRVQVERLLLPDIQRDSPERHRIIQSAIFHGTELIFVENAMEISVGETEVQLYPPFEDGKNASLCALMSYQEYDILITGDMDAASERRLICEYPIPQVELLIAGHHGSKSSTCEELLNAAKPQTVLICVGRNSYGHPAMEVLIRIASVGAKTHRTDLQGEFTVTR